MESVKRLTSKAGLPFFSPKDVSFLPSPIQQPSKIRVRTLLGHCLYRRVIIWTVAVLFLLFLALFSGAHGGRERILELVEFGKGGAKGKGNQGAHKGGGGPGGGGGPKGGAVEAPKEPPKPTFHWMKYRQYVPDPTIQLIPPAAEPIFYPQFAFSTFYFYFFSRETPIPPKFLFGPGLIELTLVNN